MPKACHRTNIAKNSKATHHEKQPLLQIQQRQQTERVRRLVIYRQERRNPGRDIPRGAHMLLGLNIVLGGFVKTLIIAVRHLVWKVRRIYSPRERYTQSYCWGLRCLSRREEASQNRKTCARQGMPATLYLTRVPHPTHRPRNHPYPYSRTPNTLHTLRPLQMTVMHPSSPRSGR